MPKLDSHDYRMDANDEEEANLEVGEDEEEEDSHFSILGGDDGGSSSRPRSLAVHSKRGIVFFANLASPIREDTIR